MEEQATNFTLAGFIEQLDDFNKHLEKEKPKILKNTDEYRLKINIENLIEYNNRIISNCRSGNTIDSHRPQCNGNKVVSDVQFVGQANTQDIPQLEVSVLPNTQSLSSSEASTTKNTYELSHLEELVTKNTQVLTSLEKLATKHDQTLSSIEASVTPNTQVLTSLEKLATKHYQTLSSIEASVTPNTQILSSLEELATKHDQTLSSLEASVTQNMQTLLSLAADVGALKKEIKAIGFNINTSMMECKQLTIGANKMTNRGADNKEMCTEAYDVISGKEEIVDNKPSVGGEAGNIGNDVGEAQAQTSKLEERLRKRQEDFKKLRNAGRTLLRMDLTREAKSGLDLIKYDQFQNQTLDFACCLEETNGTATYEAIENDTCVYVIPRANAEYNKTRIVKQGYIVFFDIEEVDQIINASIDCIDPDVIPAVFEKNVIGKYELKEKGKLIPAKR